MKVLILALMFVFAPGTDQAGAADSAALVATGAYHACSARSGKLLCWGSNSAGELGNGSTKQSFVPVAVKNLSGPVTEVSASYDRTCAIVGGKVFCWGRYAKLDSSGKWTSSSKPTKLSGTPPGVHGLSVGVTHACVLDATNYPWCWGLNDRGQLGDGTTKYHKVPVRAKLSGVSQLASSDGYTCAVASGMMCWGRSHGTAGDLLNPEGLVVNSNTPKSIPGLEAALSVSVSATGDFAVALLADGSVMAWGENDHGQLGDGTLVGKSTPQAVAGLAPSVQVVATANHACSINTNDRHVVCWGRGDHGQLGDGTIGDRLVPGPFVAINEPVATLYGAASGHWTMAVTDTGTYYVWGRNQNGVLLDGTTNDQPTPIAVTLP